MPPELSSIALPDPAAPWEAIGFHVVGRVIELGTVEVSLDAGAPAPALAIAGVPREQLDGVPLVEPALSRPHRVDHPNGVIGIDHFVIVTPDFDRTAAALEDAGLPFRRVRDAGGFRQGFRRLGPAILEVVEVPQMAAGPAQFWGITFVVSDLDALAARLGDRLRAVKDAVQPGRRIATLDRSAGLSPQVAFMTPERVRFRPDWSLRST